MLNSLPSTSRRFDMPCVHGFQPGFSDYLLTACSLDKMNTIGQVGHISI